MGEKELMVSTPLPTKYVKGNEESFETSFQALKIVGTTNVETEEGDPRPSRDAIIIAKVLINNGFQPNSATRKLRTIQTWLCGDCEEGKIGAESPTDITEPLPLFH
ncbi:hypothetical protein CR513_44249, partial [Mucuna pruriens]